jgi:hypothetical protein
MKIPVLKKGYIGRYAGDAEEADIDTHSTFIDARKGFEPSLTCSCGNCGDYSFFDAATLRAALRQMDAIEKAKPAALRKAERILRHATDYLYKRDWINEPAKVGSNPAFRILHKALHG